MNQACNVEKKNQISKEAKKNFLKFLDEVKKQSVNSSVVNHGNHSNHGNW